MNEKRICDEKKFFFIIFKGLSVARNCLSPEIAPLTETVKSQSFSKQPFCRTLVTSKLSQKMVHCLFKNWCSAYLEKTFSWSFESTKRFIFRALSNWYNKQSVTVCLFVSICLTIQLLNNHLKRSN